MTKGDKLTYDLTSGQATVDTGGTSGRVKGLFLPGSSDERGSPPSPRRRTECFLGYPCRSPQVPPLA